MFLILTQIPPTGTGDENKVGKPLDEQSKLGYCVTI